MPLPEKLLIYCFISVLASESVEDKDLLLGRIVQIMV
jgi:hypothetical protein